MDETLILLFIFGLGFTSCSAAPPGIRRYHYVSQPMTWSDAQKYCRLYHSDLATFESMDDLSRLTRPRSQTSWAWFGLTDDPITWWRTLGSDSNSWKWSATGETSKSSYSNWAVYQPNHYSSHKTCVMVDSNGRWNDVSCSVKQSFVCYTAINPSGLKEYYLITISMTWEDAQTYCRRLHTDLALIEDASENTKMMLVKLRRNAWIGLYRVLWRWSDGSNSSFRNWGRGQPNNYGRQYCAAEDSKHQWNDISCQEEIPFVCQGDLKVKMSLLRMKIQSAADLSDPASSNQTLQQLRAVLMNRTAQIDFNLVWTTRPRKEKKDEK